MSDTGDAKNDMTLEDLADLVAEVSDRAERASAESQALRVENALLSARIDHLEGNDRISSRRSPADADVADTSTADASGRVHHVSRRGAMKALGAAAAGGFGLAVGSVLSSAEPAAAANGDPMLVGSLNTASGRTTLTDTDTSGSDIGLYTVLGAASGATLGSAAIVGDTSTSTGVEGATSSTGQIGVSGLDVSGGAGGTGVSGQSTNGTGVSGRGPTAGVTGAGSIGVFGQSTVASEFLAAGVVGSGNDFGLGVLAGSGLGASLQLLPFASSTLPENPAVGQFIVLNDGSLWYCYATNDWVQLNNGTVSLPAPVRVIDTVNGIGIAAGALPPGGPTAAGAPVHTTDVLSGANGIPTQALGLVGNFAISPDGPAMNGLGQAALFPAGAATPDTVNINAGSGCFAISNSVTVAFGQGADAGKLSIVWWGGGALQNMHVFFDVAAYIL